MPDEKYCGKCKRKLPLEKFSRDKSKKDGLNHTCKDCYGVYIRQHYKKNKQYYINNARVNRKKRKNKLRTIIRNIKSVSKCKICGQEHIATLDFHHRDETYKQFSLSTSLIYRYSEQQILKEISKCDILCANCHRILHYEKGNSK